MESICWLQALYDNECQSGLQDKIVVDFESANVRRPNKKVSDSYAVAIAWIRRAKTAHQRASATAWPQQ